MAGWGWRPRGRLEPPGKRAAARAVGEAELAAAEADSRCLRGEEAGFPHARLQMMAIPESSRPAGQTVMDGQTYSFLFSIWIGMTYVPGYGQGETLAVEMPRGKLRISFEKCTEPD